MATGICATEKMAEVQAESPNKHTEEPIMSESNAAQPQEVDPNVQDTEKKKKKKKRIPKSRRGITGFEEYYADTPMTPAEALEKKKLYDPARPFPERIEECIQRFRARRRLDNERRMMFDRYLFLGGIDASQRQFTGMALDTDVLADADKDQVRIMTAVDFVGGHSTRFYSDSDPDDWEVDFEAVVKGFLSQTIINWYMYDERAIRLAADLLKNFLNYVLMHDVCPEYTNNIIAARNVCEIAPTELRHMHELMLELPGTFNSAARSLFCDGKVNHIDQEKNYEDLVTFRLTALWWPLGEKTKRARELILKMEDPATIKLISTTEKTYRVLEIIRPRQKDIQMVNEQLVTMGFSGKLKPAGLIRVAPTIIEHGWGNVPRPDEVETDCAEHDELVIENELLGKFEIGMKIHVTVCRLSIGLSFIKDVHDVRVFFDTFLPQYLMTNWKEPTHNERPPPSIHNPNAEENDPSTNLNEDED